MIAYKLIRKLKDGSLSPLFINKKSRISIGVWLEAEEHPTKGFKFRKGWHCTLKPLAPHLSKKDRVWVEVEVKDTELYNRPESQGGIWVLAQRMKIIRELKKIMRATAKEEQIMMSIYKKMYLESTPKIDNLQELIDNKETQVDSWFMNYYLDQKRQDEIIEEEFKGKRLSKMVKTALRNGILLGSSPSSVDFYFKLTRLNDGKVLKAPRVRWLEFDESGRFKSWHHCIKEGRSLLMSPFNVLYVWQTTIVTEVLENKRDVVKFKTLNSEYVLERILIKE